MDGYLLIDEGTHYFRYVHQISRRALAAVFERFEQMPALYMQARLRDERLSMVPVLTFKDGDDGQVDPSVHNWGVASNTQPYAAHYKKMQKGKSCVKVVFAEKCGDAKTVSYSAYYIYRTDDTHTTLAFLHEHPEFEDGKVAMIAAPNDEHHYAALTIEVFEATNFAGMGKDWVERIAEPLYGEDGGTPDYSSFAGGVEAARADLAAIAAKLMKP
jgi:hypothetical protein